MNEGSDDKAASQYGRRSREFQSECHIPWETGFQGSSSESWSECVSSSGSDRQGRINFGSDSFWSGSGRTISGGILKQLIDEVDDQLLDFDLQIEKLNSKKQKLLIRRSSLEKLCLDLSNKTGEVFPPNINLSEEE